MFYQTAPKHAMAWNTISFRTGAFKRMWDFLQKLSLRTKISSD